MHFLLIERPLSHTSKNYLSGSGNYTYYVRKHNPTIIYDSVANVTSRALRHRNFNDFAVDVGNNSLPQWMFITPNLVNDAHDTTIDFTGNWLNYVRPRMLPSRASTFFSPPDRDFLRSGSYRS
jgi:hypothetical protein